MENKKNKLLGITIYKIDADDLLEAQKIFNENVETHWLFVDDLNEKYFVKYDITSSDKIKSLEPEDVHPFDQYELMESIVNKGKEFGLTITVSKPDVTIDPEAVKKFKELALSKIKKVDKNNTENTEPKDGDKN